MGRMTNAWQGILVEVLYCFALIAVGFLVCTLIYWGIFARHAF